jgi:tetratricopeptide (TPR) repeat protein
MDLHRFQHAIALRDAGKDWEALQELQSVRESVSDPGEKVSLLLNEAACYQNLGRLEEAEIRLEEARKIAPMDETLLYVDFSEAELRYYQERTEEAHRQFEKLFTEHSELLKSPEHRELYEAIQLRRGQVLMQLNRYDEARPLLEEALSFQLGTTVRGDLLCMLGICYFELHDLTQAEKHLRAALETGAQEAHTIRAHYFLGAIYFLQHAYDKALHEFQQVEAHAGEYDFDAGEIRQWLAKTYRRLNRIPEAEEYEKPMRPQ